MTLREFCKLSILCKDDPIYIMKEDGCYMTLIKFDNECQVGNVEDYLKDEILDKEIACITPSEGAYVVYF
jgi:hypothetical protein